MNQPIKLITFDLDNTLWDVDSIIVRAEKKLHHWFDQHHPIVNQTYSIEQLQQQRLSLYNSNDRYQHQISQLRIDSIQSMLQTLNYSTEQAQLISQQAFDVFLKERNNITLFSNVENIILQLKTDYLVGALTNGNACISLAEIEHLFDFQFSAEQLNASKPAPQQFLAALDYAGLSPNQMIHIGDHIVDDIEGANQLGIHTIWYNPNKIVAPPLNNPQPQALVAHNWLEIQTAINRIGTIQN